MSPPVSKGGAIFEFTVDRNRDPEGSKLRGLLEAQFTYQRMRAGRSLCAHLLAILGVAIWVDALWPGILAPEARLLTLFLWGGILLIAVWCAIEEQASARKLKNHRFDDGRTSRPTIEEF